MQRMGIGMTSLVKKMVVCGGGRSFPGGLPEGRIWVCVGTEAAAARRLYGAMHRHEWKVFGSKKISHVCYARIQVGPFLLINRVPPLASYYLIRPALMLQLMPI